jgi:hypothetical protein
VKYGLLVPHPANGHPSGKPLSKRLTEHHFFEQIIATGKAKPDRFVMCSKHTHTHKNEEKQFIGALNVKQNYIWMGLSRAITQISTSNLVTFFVNTQNVQLIRYANTIAILLAV